MSILEIHGTNDSHVNYTGGAHLEGVGGPYPPVATTISDWMTLNGCTPGSLAVSGDAFSLDSVIPGPETTPYSASCPPGVDVSHWNVEGGQHIPTLEPDFAERIITYLLAHPKP